jgi:predicted porin
MKRSLICLVVLVSTLRIAAAQNSLTFSGIIDTGLTRGSASGAGSVSINQMTSGNTGGPFIAFRGQEDLGNGLTAAFWLEAHVFSDDGRAGNNYTTGNQVLVPPSGLNFSRRSTVSLIGPFGEFRVGRDIVPSYRNVVAFDPFINLGVGASVIFAGGFSGLGAPAATYGLVPAGLGPAGPYARASNMIGYFSPSTWGGTYLQGGYWLGENPQNGAANEDDGSGAALRVGYEAGPLHISAGWGRTRYRATPVAATAGAPSGDHQMRNVGASWNFGPARLSGMYESDTRRSALQSQGKGWIIATAVPVGVGEILAGYSTFKIDAGPGLDPSARKVSVGYRHNLSKRTMLYASAARVQNRDGSRIALGGSTFGAGITGGRSTGTEAGIRHAF